MVVWVGGLIFFSFVEAPTAFHVMGTTRAFAQLIGGSISTLNRLGHACGLIFLLATSVLWWKGKGRGYRLFAAEFLAVALMIGATIYVQHGIIPAMERDRAAVGGDIAAAPPDNVTRVHFDRLHALSEKVEGSALFLGLGVVVLMGFEAGDARDPQVA
jgi:hypothetical protein